MLLVLFALSAHAQPAVYGSYYGGGTPSSSSGPAITQQNAVPPAPASDAPVGPSIFQLRQADRNVRLSATALQGDRFINNIPLSFFGNGIQNQPPLFFDLGAAYKADSAAQQEGYFQREINHLRATTPRLTETDRNAIDDFALQRDYAYNTKLRRGMYFFPFNDFDALDDPNSGLGTLSNVFDVRAKKLGSILAQNKLTDARRAYREQPSRENFISLRNAEDGVAQADYRQDASSFDLLGNSFDFSDANDPSLGISLYGGVFRKKASETKLESGLRNLRAARAKYAQDPSEDNRFDVQLANLFVRATEEEDLSNSNEVTTGLIFNGLNFGNSGAANTAALLWNGISAGKNTEDESRLWLRYARLEREKLQRQRARALQSESSPVAAQMLGLSLYGPRQGAF